VTISTNNLQELPDVFRLKRLLQSLAMLDAILEPNWEYRYYSFNAHWSKDEMMGSMRNGQGDEFFALFNARGVFIKGFAKGAPIRVHRIPSEAYYRGLPPELEECSREPAFSTDDVTFCVWRLNDQPSWSNSIVSTPASGDSDGSTDLLSLLDDAPESYQAWAMSYHERDLPVAAIAAIYQHQTLTERLITALNPMQRMAALTNDITEIGYPASHLSGDPRMGH
jgi:hypothetical protein